jgi:hypothetical protein
MKNRLKKQLEVEEQMMKLLPLSLSSSLVSNVLMKLRRLWMRYTQRWKQEVSRDTSVSDTNHANI